MTRLQKLLAATAMVGASFAMAAPADALLTASAGTKFIASGTAPSVITLSGNTITVSSADIPGLTPFSGGFASTFADGATLTLTLPSGTFAATPTITPNAGPAPVVSAGTGAGFNTLTITFAAGTTNVMSSVVFSTIAINGIGSAAAGNYVVTLSGSALGGTPAEFLTATIAAFAAPVGFTARATDVALSSATAKAFQGAKGSLGVLVGVITPTRLYDGVSATIIGAPTAEIATYASNAGSLSNVTFTESSGASTPCMPASTAVTVVASPVTNTATGTGAFNGCTLGVTLTPSGSAALATGAVTLAVNVPITNGPVGATQVTQGATAIGSVVTASGTIAVPMSYNFGADAAYGFYVSVTLPSTAATTNNVTFTSGPWTSGNFSVAPGTTGLFSIESIRASLMSNSGAPSSIFTNSSARHPLTVTAPAGAQITALIQNKGQNIVTEVGNNLGKAGLNQ